MRFKARLAFSPRSLVFSSLAGLSPWRRSRALCRAGSPPPRLAVLALAVCLGTVGAPLRALAESSTDSGFISATNPANGSTGTTAPVIATEVGGVDSLGVLHALSVDSGGALIISPNSGLATSANQVTYGNQAHADALGINTSLGTLDSDLLAFKSANHTDLGVLDVDLGTVNTNLGTINTSLGTINTSVGSAATQAHTDAGTAHSDAVSAQGSLSSIDGKTPALGQALDAASVPVVLPADQLATLTPPTSVTVVQPTGTNLHTVVDSSALPAGAATSAKQPALGVAGTPSSDVISVQGETGMTPLLVDGSGVTQPVSAASLPLPAGASTSAKQPALGTAGTASSDVLTVQGIASMTALKVDGSSVTQPVSIASAPAPVNAGGSFASGSATTTASSLSPPSNAVGFIIQCQASNADNLRFAVGGTATTSSGVELLPGQDSGFIPAGSAVSVIAETSTADYNIQWVAQ